MLAMLIEFELSLATIGMFLTSFLFRVEGNLKAPRAARCTTALAPRSARRTTDCTTRGANHHGPEAVWCVAVTYIFHLSTV